MLAMWAAADPTKQPCNGFRDVPMLARDTRRYSTSDVQKAGQASGRIKLHDFSGTSVKR